MASPGSAAHPSSVPEAPSDLPSAAPQVPGSFLDPQVVPADRHRRAARVVLLDGDRVLLEHVRVASDPAQGAWWELPGGGLDPGEDTAAAAMRELAEETGYLDVAMGVALATLRIRYRTSRHVVEQHETIHVARLRSRRRAEPRLEAAEAEGLQAVAWLTLEELTDGRRLVLPQLQDLVADVLADRLVARRLGDHDVTGWSDARPDPIPIAHDGATARRVDGPAGALVVRDAAPWTDTVHRRLARLRAAGHDRVPEPLGIDAHGREAMRMVPDGQPGR